MDYDYDELMCISAELLAEQAAAGELSDDTLRRIGHLSRFCKCLASAAPNGGKQWSLASAFAAHKAWTRGIVVRSTSASPRQCSDDMPRFARG
jgi:hypothetical protein